MCVCFGGVGGREWSSDTCSTPRNSHKVRSEGIIQVFMRQAGGDETLSGVGLFLEVTELFVDSWP